LFDPDNEKGRTAIDELKDMNPELLNATIAAESPELLGLVDEFKISLDLATNKLKPLINKIHKREIASTSAGLSYLETRHSLTMNYCTYLAFYLLMKIEGANLQDHPVIFRLAHIKTLLEKLQPLDDKLQEEIDRKLEKIAAQEEMEEEEGEAEMDEDSEGVDEEELSDDDEEEE